MTEVEKQQALEAALAAGPEFLREMVALGIQIYAMKATDDVTLKQIDAVLDDIREKTTDGHVRIQEILEARAEPT